MPTDVHCCKCRCSQLFGISSPILDVKFVLLKTPSSDNGNFAFLVALYRRGPFWHFRDRWAEYVTQLLHVVPAVRRIRKIAKKRLLNSSLMSVRLSVCLSVYRMKQLGSYWKGFHKIWYEYFSKICRENSSFIIIWQEQHILYIKTNKLFDHTSLNCCQSEECFEKKL
jgi:hypothetical protein